MCVSCRKRFRPSPNTDTDNAGRSIGRGCPGTLSPARCIGGTQTPRASGCLQDIRCRKPHQETSREIVPKCVDNHDLKLAFSRYPTPLHLVPCGAKWIPLRVIHRSSLNTDREPEHSRGPRICSQAFIGTRAPETQNYAIAPFVCE